MTRLASPQGYKLSLNMKNFISYSRGDQSSTSGRVFIVSFNILISFDKCAIWWSSEWLRMLQVLTCSTFWGFVSGLVLRTDATYAPALAPPKQKADQCIETANETKKMLDFSKRLVIYEQSLEVSQTSIGTRSGFVFPTMQMTLVRQGNHAKQFHPSKKRLRERL